MQLNYGIPDLHKKLKSDKKLNQLLIKADKFFDDEWYAGVILTYKKAFFSGATLSGDQYGNYGESLRESNQPHAAIRPFRIAI